MSDSKSRASARAKQQAKKTATPFSAINAEITAIVQADADPVEALYRWIDSILGIPKDNVGGASSSVDALPAYLDLPTGQVLCAPVPAFGQVMTKLSRPILLGLAKYEVATGKFLETVLLKSWSVAFCGYTAKLADAVKDAYEHALTCPREEVLTADKLAHRMGCSLSLLMWVAYDCDTNGGWIHAPADREAAVKDIRAIGSLLHKAGGFRMMQTVFQTEPLPRQHLRALEVAWHGIGDWLG